MMSGTRTQRVSTGDAVMTIVVDPTGHIYYDAPEWFQQVISQARVEMPYTTLTAKSSKRGYPTPLYGKDDLLGDNYIWPSKAGVIELLNPELHPDRIRFACDDTGRESIHRIRVVDRYGSNGGVLNGK